MELRAINLFTRFSHIQRLYRAMDGEYFVELDDVEAYLIGLGSGGYTIIERTNPLPPIPAAEPDNRPIWILVNNPVATGGMSYDGVVSFTTTALAILGLEVHRTNRIGAYKVGNYVLVVSRVPYAAFTKYGVIRAIVDNDITIEFLSFSGVGSFSTDQWNIILTGQAGSGAAGTQGPTGVAGPRGLAGINGIDGITYDGVVSSTGDTLSSLMRVTHACNKAGAFKAGNYILLVSRDGATLNQSKYGKIFGVLGNNLVIDFISFSGIGSSYSESWDIALTGERGTNGTQGVAGTIGQQGIAGASSLLGDRLGSIPNSPWGAFDVLTQEWTWLPVPTYTELRLMWNPEEGQYNHVVERRENLRIAYASEFGVGPFRTLLHHKEVLHYVGTNAGPFKELQLVLTMENAKQISAEYPDFNGNKYFFEAEFGSYGNGINSIFIQTYGIVYSDQPVQGDPIVNENLNLYGLTLAYFNPSGDQYYAPGNYLQVTLPSNSFWKFYILTDKQNDTTIIAQKIS